jgi:Uncharacterized protein conserved in bacteria (DUF2252)
MKTDVVEATQRYEEWLGQHVEIQPDELSYKHEQMARRDDPFPFVRGTYYRWAEIWPSVCPELQEAPRVLAVGDLHVENFGTWRDREARLVWGINDFDEADELPFANDLVRLAASASFGAGTASFEMSFKKTCRAILSGFAKQLRNGGRAFVLEEENPELRKLAMQADRAPDVFWRKLVKVLNAPPRSVPAGAEAALKHDLPVPHTSYEVRRRPRVGMGSLGKPRFVALATVTGGWVAREAKAVAPPATTFLRHTKHGDSRLRELLSIANRSADPFLRIDHAWIVRRLAPHCTRIELTHLQRAADELVLFEAMGAETANVHLGTPSVCDEILRWLKARDDSWLETAAKAMIRATRDDWKTWCKASRKATISQT